MELYDHYIVVRPDGHVTNFDTGPTGLYDLIVEHIGSPFDTAVFGTTKDGSKTVRVEGYIRDMGLFDGSEPNYPILAAWGLPICGPVLLHSGADHNGDTQRPWNCAAIRSLLAVANTIHSGLTAIEHNRENPFTIEMIGR